jgi:hypothetical protein
LLIGPFGFAADLCGVEVKLHGVRQDSPPMMISIDYELIVDTDEIDRRLAMLPVNVRKSEPSGRGGNGDRARKGSSTGRRSKGKRHDSH